MSGAIFKRKRPLLCLYICLSMDSCKHFLQGHVKGVAAFEHFLNINNNDANVRNSLTVHIHPVWGILKMNQVFGNAK